MSESNPSVPFHGLASADLQIGRVYEGGGQPNVGADPLHKLMGVGNSGGFRYRNVKTRSEVALCVLFTTGGVSEWPDGFAEDGNYVYFGDQRKPGKDIHDTALHGNRLLADVGVWTRHGEAGRRKVPPFFLFEKAGKGRDVRFEGLLGPCGARRLVDRRVPVERRGKIRQLSCRVFAPPRKRSVSYVADRGVGRILERALGP